MIRIPFTLAEFAAKAAQLKAEQGIALTGNSGTISKSGVKANYEFDGEELAVTVISKPYLMTTKFVEGQLLKWLNS